MKVLKEFKEFINKGNVIDLAVAVVIGGAFGKIVSAIVADLVMPLVNAVMPQGDWRKWEVTPLHFRVGDFLGTLVDFTIVAFVIFIVMVKVVGTVNRRPPATKECPECLEMVPKAAKRCRACTSVFTVLALMLLAAPAFAQGNPTFSYGKPEEIKVGAPPPPPVDWKAMTKAGLSYMTGNSRATNGMLALAVSRRESANKFSLDGTIAYGRSDVLVPQIGPDPVDPAMTMVITGIERRPVTTTNNWLTKARYDRFFTANNSGYLTGLAAADRIAGKSFVGGGQVGYSRQLVNNSFHILVSELGYDFSHERYVAQPDRVIDPVTIHSARLFVGETMKMSPTSGATMSVEALFNLNRETNALDAGSGPPATKGVAPFHDTRVVGKAGLTTTVLARLSVGFGFTLRYDQNPPPRPIPSGTPAGIPYGTGVQPFSDKLDTLAEATLIYTFI
jgi:large conductance mechanosensitive channel